MKLYITGHSPFARKVRIVAREVGLASDVEEIKIDMRDASSPHRKINPLGKIPTGVLEDGSLLMDSPVLCEYLMERAGDTSLVPTGEAKWADATLQALADGMTESVIALVIENGRPADKQLQERKDRAQGVIDRSLAELDRQAARYDDTLTMGRIAVISGLGYMEYRLGDHWRAQAPKLAAWYDRMHVRPSVKETVVTT
jgi:glutathione S-transferase